MQIIVFKFWVDMISLFFLFIFPVVIFSFFCAEHMWKKLQFVLVQFVLEKSHSCCLASNVTVRAGTVHAGKKSQLVLFRHRSLFFVRYENSKI